MRIRFFWTVTRANRRNKPLLCVCAVLLGALAMDFAVAGRAADFPPKLHAAWVYDVLNRPGVERRNDPGFFANELNEYNRLAGDAHKIRGIYTYLGSVEMYCPGRDPTLCRENHLRVTSLSRQPSSKRERSPTSAPTLRAYKKQIDAEIANGEPVLVAVIDGVVNADYEGSMKGFNQLSQQQAEILADKVSHQVCSDPLIAGVQFDIEPFDIGSPGQYYFYRRIADNFAGNVAGHRGAADTQCVDNDHPQGRFFSVFAPSHQLRPGSQSAANLQTVLTRKNNGYVIAPLYDLGSGSAGHALSVDEYEARARRHARQMREWAGELGVKYKFGIPVAATVHEFASCKGRVCKDETGDNNRSQLDYTIAALQAINESGARQDSLFLGNVVWAWSRGIIHHESRFEPNTPPIESQEYLATNL